MTLSKCTKSLLSLLSPLEWPEVLLFNTIQFCAKNSFVIKETVFFPFLSKIFFPLKQLRAPIQKFPPKIALNQESDPTHVVAAHHYKSVVQTHYREVNV